jgi:hypothetical protein
MSSDFVRVTNFTNNNLSLVGDEGIPNVGINGFQSDVNYVDVSVTQLVGNILLCNVLSGWIIAGIVTVTRDSKVLSSDQILSFKIAMTKDVYDANLNDLSDIAEELNYINYINIDDTDSPYTVLGSDFSINADVSGGTITVNLPQLTAANNGRIIRIFDSEGNASLNNVSIVPYGTDKINGVNAPVEIDRDYDGISLTSLGGTTGWYYGLVGLQGVDVSRVGDTIYEIFTMSDFPNPTGDVISLPSGRYEIKNSITTDKRFEIPASSSVTWTMSNQRYNTFTYLGSGDLFSGLNFTRFNLKTVNLVMVGSGAQLYNFMTETGPLGQFVFRSGQVIFAAPGGTIGYQSRGSTRIDDMFCLGFEDGITISDTSFSYITETILQSAPGSSGTYVSILGNVGFFGCGNTSVFVMGASNSGFYIDPTVTGPVNITETVPATPFGDYYKLGTTGPISSFTDTSTSPTAVSVTNDGGEALFTSVGHGLNVGELPIHTTFPETTYNTFTAVVTDVPTADTYKVGISYVSDSSGLFATTTCQVNDVAHGLSYGTSLSIMGTINFDAGYKIFNVQTDSFEITLGKVFPGSESTGGWSTGSLNQKSKYVVALNNGSTPNSKNLGTAVVGGNTEPTEITIQHQFEDLNLDAAMVEAGNIELWKVVNTTTGEIRYDGLFSTSMTYEGLVSAISIGAANRFDFRLLKKPLGGSYSPLPSPDNVDIPMDVNGTLRSMVLLWPIAPTPGDTYKLQVANRDGTSNLRVDTLKINII